MRYFCWLCFALLIMATVGCNNANRNNETTSKDTLVVDTKIDSSVSEKEVLTTIGTEILIALKAKDYRAFAVYFHPKKGVIFSPYGYIDKSSAKQLSKANFLKIIEEHGAVNWGAYDGTGDPIRLTAQKYLEQFVYNADYLNAEKTSFNQVIGKGNANNNLKDVLPGAPFLEYYFSGFNKQNEGMDWTSLRLVFEKYENGYFLIAVIHDQWTI